MHTTPKNTKYGSSSLSSSGGSELMDSAFGYFITACAVIGLAILSYVALPKLVSIKL